MPGCAESNSPPPSPPDPWTVARAQAALGEVAFRLLAAVDVLGRVHTGLPLPPDVDARHEHRKPFDQATEIVATVECVIEDNLRPAIASLQRAGAVTDELLREEFRQRSGHDV
jgi:hypothetical protein